jgi:TolB-like protein/Flp pilus assembly protein TadD
MFHVAGLYSVSAWLLVQIADAFAGVWAWPAAALRLLWTALILGFPIALIFGWRYDVTKQGIVRTVPHTGGKRDAPLRPVDRTIIVALSLVTASILGLTAVEMRQAIELDRRGLAGEFEEVNRPAPANSIAVLPFSVCSGGDVDEVLAAGLAAEVINRLAGLGTIKVIARASSFTVAGLGLSAAEIARPLRVKYLLTGELCRENDRLVLRVELADELGYTVWSERYDQAPDRSDRVTITLAAQVAEGVSSVFGQGVNGLPEAPVNRLAYEQVLIGREYAGQGNVDRAKAAFDKALQYDPEYPDAFFELARLVVQEATQGGDLGYSSVRQSRPIVERAVELARRRVAERDDDFNTLLTAGEILYTGGKWTQWLAWTRQGELAAAELDERLGTADALFREAEGHMRKALVRNPSHVPSYIALGYILERQGVHRRDEALSAFEQGLGVDPFNAEINREYAKRLAARGRYRQAMEHLERFEALPTVPPEIRFVQLEIEKLQTYWDEKCELLIEMLLNEPAAFEHAGNYGHLVWFPSELARLGLFETAEAWYQRVETIPAEGWAGVLRDWFLGEYLSIEGVQAPTGGALAGDEEDEGPDDLAVLAGMTDEEILDQNLYDAPWTLAEAGEADRAIHLAESFQNLRPARGDSTFWAERLAWGQMRLASLYRWGGRDEEAAELLAQIARGLEAEYDVGIRHPTTLANLASVYALQGRDDDALAMLRRAVDYHLRWTDIPELPGYAPWKRLEEDPRFVAQWDRMQADLRQQGARIGAMLARYDIDELLGPAMAMAESRAAVAAAR